MADQLGAGLSSFYGDGSDGAFAPAAPGTVSATFTFNGTGWQQSGASLQPSNAPSFPWKVYSTGSSPRMGVVSNGNVFDGTLYDTNQIVASQGQTLMCDLTVNTSVTISALRAYTITAGITLALAIWDASNGQLLGVGTCTTINGVSQATLSGGVPLTSGKTYRMGFLPLSGSCTFYRSGGGQPGQTGTALGSNIITFTSTADGAPVVKQYTSVNIPFGCFVTVSNRCKGLFIISTGDVTINGKINMDGLSPLLDPTTNPGYGSILQGSNLVYPLGTNQVIPFPMGGTGGNGGNGGNGSGNGLTGVGGKGGSGSPGSWWGGGRGGGGGGGAVVANYSSYTNSGNGGNGGNPDYTSWSNATNGITASSGSNTVVGVNGNNGLKGGGGSGAGCAYGSSTSYPATATGGSGGNGTNAGGGGGGGAFAGDDTGTGINVNGGIAASAWGTGGGLICVITAGNLAIGAGAGLTANGAEGGHATDAIANSSTGNNPATGVGGGGGAGGSGGGVIVLLYKKTYTNNGILQVTGGAGGSAGANYTMNYTGQNGTPGASGGNGTILPYQLPSTV